jgi:hypothetical protein
LCCRYVQRVNVSVTVPVMPVQWAHVAPAPCHIDCPFRSTKNGCSEITQNYPLALTGLYSSGWRRLLISVARFGLTRVRSQDHLHPTPVRFHIVLYCSGLWQTPSAHHFVKLTGMTRHILVLHALARAKSNLMAGHVCVCPANYATRMTLNTLGSKVIVGHIVWKRERRSLLERIVATVKTESIVGVHCFNGRDRGRCWFTTVTSNAAVLLFISTGALSSPRFLCAAIINGASSWRHRCVMLWPWLSFGVNR